MERRHDATAAVKNRLIDGTRMYNAVKSSRQIEGRQGNPCFFFFTEPFCPLWLKVDRKKSVKVQKDVDVQMCRQQQDDYGILHSSAVLEISSDGHQERGLCALIN